MHDVPSILQMPTGNRWDSRQALGCEEASILMTYAWATGKNFTPAEAEREITAMADFEKTVMFGFHQDTGAADTAKLMREYYGYANVEVRRGISTRHIHEALQSGAVVIVPLDTRKLVGKKGVSRHTVAVTGYDEARKEFIINDPLARNPIRAKESSLRRALRDYRSGIRGVLLASSAMIVIHK